MQYKNFLDDKQLLSMKNYNEIYDIAWKQIEQGWRTENPELLSFFDIDNNFYSLAHKQVYHGWRTENPKILFPDNTDYCHEISVVQYQVNNGWRTEIPELLKMIDITTGRTLAHAQAAEGWVTENPDILFPVDDAHSCGISVVAIQLENGWTTENPELLKMIDVTTGLTLAHSQARLGWTTDNPDILSIRKFCPSWNEYFDFNGERGLSVAEVIEKYQLEPIPLEKGKSIANECGIPVSKLVEFINERGHTTFSYQMEKSLPNLIQDVRIWDRCKNADMSGYLSLQPSVKTCKPAPSLSVRAC